mmetsp:Transcript_44799/g.97393  ORF Transcript_44799/g.97393 Transcript_44799/m.97393 type:complete len:118 (+) Transcript_44799:447-800(+)
MQTRTSQLQSKWCSICKSSNCSCKSNFWLCKKSSRQWKWQQQQQLRQALKTNLARRYLPSQPMKIYRHTRQQSPPAQGAKDQARSKAKTKEQIDSEVQSDQRQEAKGRVTSSCACAL